MAITNEKRIFSETFFSYTPAEIRTNKDWIIVFYAKNPTTGKLERQRVRVPKLKGYTDRMRIARKMVMEINHKLENGWSPFMQQSGKNFHSWNDAIAGFEKYLSHQVKNEVFRPDTLRTYKSNLSLIRQYIEEKHIQVVFALDFNKAFCNGYLDWIYIERQKSARTRNNQLVFLRMLANYFIGSGILGENPTNGIKNLPKTEKIRKYIPPAVREEILTEVKQWPSGFSTMIELVYYCLIRNKELINLKVGNILIEKKLIEIPANISKNKKHEFVTIPEPFEPILKKHIAGAKADEFLFSENHFYPGTTPINDKKILYQWNKLRQKIGFKKEYHFYSLKDTGITDLFFAGVSSMSIKNQARHSSVSITEIYAHKISLVDQKIKNSGILANGKK
jgi:site-specific recombinase XerD